ncbi:hypothetical protein Pelo_1080 [Pelomyxa schiedti]|nr:hypothetical protein Pelo_1080 [Pelomyxa schiedti]
MPFCGSCGSKIADGSRFCPGCGTAVGPVGRFCSSCNNKLADDARFCPVCGTAAGGSAAKPSSSSSSSSPSTSARASPSSTTSSSPSTRKVGGTTASQTTYQKSIHYASPEVKPVGPASSATEHCPGCGGVIGGGEEKLVVTGKEWHRTCYLSRGSGSPTVPARETGGGGALKCSLPEATYERQPDWAFAERSKNKSGKGGQYKDGMFRS